MISVAVLGSSGMIGSELVRYLSLDPDLRIISTVRSLSDSSDSELNNVTWKVLNVEEENIVQNLRSTLQGVSFVINCIGVTKYFINDKISKDVERAIRINSLFPRALSKLSIEMGFKVIQISTDCVYSGREGSYNENSAHDATDVYGKTKSMGEIYDNQKFYNLRCSMIGPEKKSFEGLLEWFLRNAKSSTISGFANHYWNGITTYHFAKICSAIVKNDLELPVLQHVVPADSISKYDLLKVCAKFFNREDISIKKTTPTSAINRILSTLNPDINREIWKLAGYDSPPSIKQMVEEISKIYKKL